MVCTSVYRAAVEGKALPGSRKGVCWEADQIKQEIYDANSRKEKFVPIFFEGASEDDVPARLRGVSHFFSMRWGRIREALPQDHRPAAGPDAQLGLRSLRHSD